MGGRDISPKFRMTYKAGVTLQYMFSPSWGIQSGVNLKEAGTNKSNGVISLENNQTVTCRIALRYAELLLTAVYKYTVNPNVRIGIRAGGYAAYGYGGRGNAGRRIERLHRHIGCFQGTHQSELHVRSSQPVGLWPYGRLTAGRVQLYLEC